MTDAQTLLNQENHDAGKTVPNWRYYTLSYLGLAMYLLGAFTEYWDWSSWLSLGIAIAYLITFSVLLAPYVKKVIH